MVEIWDVNPLEFGSMNHAKGFDRLGIQANDVDAYATPILAVPWCARYADVAFKCAEFARNA
jgi:hypothetical protein